MRAWLVCAVGACALAGACGDDDDSTPSAIAGASQAGGMAGEAADDSSGGSTSGKSVGGGTTSGGSDARAGASTDEGGAPQASAGAPAGGEGGAAGEPIAVPDPRCEAAEADALVCTGTPEDPYLVCLPSQLKLLDTATYPLSAAFALGLDLDVSQLTPPLLGGDAKPVSGTFDGRYHHIDGLTVALFGTVAATGEVRNLSLAGVLTGQTQHGLLALANDGSLDNVKVSGSFELTDHAGALVGTNHATGKILHCSSSGTIGKSFNHVGGLVGENDGTISESFSSVNIKGGNRVGGLVGNLTMPGLIERSYSVGNVTGDSSVGGFVGTLFSGEIRDCYTRAELVTGPAAGGLVGHIYGTSKIVNSYTISAVSGQDAHGFVGLVQGTPDITVTSSYFNAARADTLGTGLTLANLKKQASFVDWDFASVWQMKPALSAYPSLHFESQ